MLVNGGNVRNQNIGCFSFVAFLLLGVVLWKAVLYVGIPIAILFGVVAAYIFDSAKNEDYKEDADEKRFIAIGIGVSAAILFIVSLTGNIFTEDGPFGNPDSEENAKPIPRASGETAEIIPSRFHGRWVFNDDCEDYYSAISVKGDRVDFPEIDFVPDKVTAQASRSISFDGATISGGSSWADAGYQNDTMKLEISEDRQTLWINGSKLTRCPE